MTELDTGKQLNPYAVTIHGSVSGEPRSISFDTKEVLAKRHALHAETVSEEQLDINALQLASDITRVQEAVQRPKPEPSRLQKIAVRVGSFIQS